jgi:hypothetical protein
MKRIFLSRIAIIAMAAFIATLVGKDVSAQTPAPATDSAMFDIATIFEDMNIWFPVPVGLRPMPTGDERFLGVLGGVRHGYTYFDFTGRTILDLPGGGILSRVAFTNGPNSTGGSGWAIGADTEVHVEIDGEWQSAWFFSGQLTLRLVMPIIIWDSLLGNHDRPVEIAALLVVGIGLGPDDHIRIITLRDNTIHVYLPNFEDARPHWYWYDTDEE